MMPEHIFAHRYLLENYGQLGPKTSRPKTSRPRKKSAQDNSAQVVPISEDNSAQIAPIFEDLSAHENQTPLNVLKMIGWWYFYCSVPDEGKAYADVLDQIAKVHILT